MQILDRRTFLATTAFTTGAIATGLRAAPRSAEVFTADPAGALVDSTVLIGEDTALLVDAQINRANAEALANVIAATGKRLETVFITHFHPDHVLGLGVILDRFPDARPVAHRAVQAQIAATAQGMLTEMSSHAPAGTFADRVVVPEPLAGESLQFEGERIDILGPLQGDTELVTPLHIPALDTLIATDVVFNGTHAWVAETTAPGAAEGWYASLDQLESLGAGTVIPGHRAGDAPNDASGFAQTRAYLKAWEAALDATSSADDLKAAMLEGREDLALGFALERAVAAAYPG